jgi:hypothetical protein
MRPTVLVLFLSMALLVPKLGNAQAYMLPTPPPQVTAANALWQINGEPVFFQGDFYFPTGPTVYFDGNVMVRSGMYRRVPLYVDATLSAGTLVYLPIGGNVMRPYERRRYGDLAGTTGSRMPSFPIQRDVELSASSGAVGLITPALGPLEEPVAPEAIEAQAPAQPMVGTFNASGTFTTGTGGQPGAAASIAAPPQRLHVESIPAPRSNAGIWIEFNGSRWYSAGPAVPYFEDRFVQVGDYRGFAVYRQRNGPSNVIWVPAVVDGPLAPYRR